MPPEAFWRRSRAFCWCLLSSISGSLRADGVVEIGDLRAPRAVRPAGMRRFAQAVGAER